jgi:hypothetical protein
VRGPQHDKLRLLVLQGAGSIPGLAGEPVALAGAAPAAPIRQHLPGYAGRLPVCIARLENRLGTGPQRQQSAQLRAVLLAQPGEQQPLRCEFSARFGGLRILDRP